MKDRNKEQGGICHTKKERQIERNTYFQTCSLPRSRLSSVALALSGVCALGGDETLNQVLAGLGSSREHVGNGLLVDFWKLRAKVAYLLK